MKFFPTTAGRVDFAKVLASTDGLREAQIGASWAAVSHFTTSSEPALLVLPTGVGKTALMTLLPLLIKGINRVLVITPTRVVRRQVVTEFETLAVLKSTGCLPRELVGPAVGIADSRIRTTGAWSTFTKFDVVVGLPNSLSPANKNGAPPPRDLFDLVIVDEAHHIPAATWSELLESVDAKKVYLTATPFRRDGRVICAHPAYSYSLKRAIKAGIYVPIDYRQVVIQPKGDRDHQLAMAAKQRLGTQTHVAQRSKLLVRTDRVAEARRLREVYEGLGVHLAVVTAETSEQRMQAVRKELATGKLDGLAFVGVLGEGFDCPALKIAVYHEPHQSVPATLQFVGRIARTIGDAGRPPVAELLAPSDDRPRLLRTLYMESAEWAELLPRLFEETIAKQKTQKPSVLHGVGSLDPLRLKPFFKARIFRVGRDVVLDRSSVAEEAQLAGSRVDGNWISSDAHLLAVFTRHAQEPRWYPEPIPFGDVGELTVVVRSRRGSPRLLFVSTTETEPVLNELLARVLAISVSELPTVLDPIDADDMKKALSSLRPERFVGLGLRSALARSAYAASYRTLAGQNAALALGPLELRSCFFGHALGLSYGSDDAVTTSSTQVGASLGRSTVWTTRWDDLEAYRAWCDELAEAIASGAYEIAAKLRVSFPVRRLQFSGRPLGAVFDSWFYVDREAHELQLRSDDVTTPVTATSIAVKQNGQRLRYSFECDGNSLLVADMDTAGKFYLVSGASLISGRRSLPVESVLANHPPLTFMSSGWIVRGPDSFQLVQPGARVLEELDLFEIQDWSGCSVDIEKPRRGKVSVFDFVQSRLSISDWPYLLTDDGANEIGDFLAVRPSRSSVQVLVVHCKAQKTSQPSADTTKNLNYLVAQAIRSQNHLALPPEALWPEIARRLTSRKGTSLLRGNKAKFARGAETWKSKAIEMDVVLVQPGLSHRELSKKRGRNACVMLESVWMLLHSNRARMRIWCSS
jgi:superfamily II DNA or RNA helicase